MRHKYVIYLKNIQRSANHPDTKYKEPMKKNLLILVLAAAVLVGAIYLIKLSQPKVAVATLNSQNNSGQAGTATIVNTPDGKSLITITLFGVTAGLAQPAHIHSGTCNNLGDVKYQLAHVFNGNSQTALQISVGALVREMPLAVNVHKSDSQANVYTSCGNLQIP